MMQRNVPTLNFNTCFHMPSNPTPPTLYDEHPPTQRQMYTGQHVSYSNQQIYFSQSEKNNTQMFNWCHKQEKQNQHPTQLSLNTTPPTSTHDTRMVSPNQLSPRPDYFYPVTQNSSVCSTSPRSSSQFDNPLTPFSDAKQGNQESYSIDYYPNQHPQLHYTTGGSSSPVASNESTGFQTPMSGHFFPETPQTCISMSSPQSPNIMSSPTNASSLITTPPLANAFATIDQWHKQNYGENQQWNAKQNNFSSEYTPSTEKNDRSCSINIPSGHQLKKVAHNAIERRYRTNINECIHELKNVVPALYKAKIKEKKSGEESESDDDDDDDELEIVDGVEIAKKLNKATILHKATQYILHLKYVNDLAEKENQVLQQIISKTSGGDKVLNHFLNQKAEFQQREQRRLAHERKMNAEREKIERQRILRERAAQRAALAELLPKQGRRPYRRRAKKNINSVAGNMNTKTK